MKRYMIAGALIISTLGCNKGSNKDPETNDLGEFNPPGELQSLTRSKKLVLTWVGANAEDDFQGYHVFGTTKTISELSALVKYPSSTDITKGASIPRCKSNNDFFAAFGFPESTADCESSVVKKEATASTLKGATLLLADTATTEEDSLKIDFNIPCTGDGQKVSDGSLSLAAKDGKSLGRSFCDVEKVYDPDAKALADLKNGTSYVYMVVAVKGSDKNQISWISNLVSDTPAHSIYAASLTLATAKYAVLSVNTTTFTGTMGSATPCATSNACLLGETNATADKGIYIARDNVGTVKQRIFVSTTTADGSIQLQARGNQTWLDPRDEETVMDQMPGDTAQTDYAAAGTTFEVYGNQVFDVRITTAANTYLYGKLAITNLTLASAKTADSDATLDVSFVLQEKVNSVDYLLAP